MKILIERFKSIASAELELDAINVLVGGNNAGKSSIIHAIQFAVSCSQALNINSKGKFRKKSKKGTAHNSTLSPDELFYSPIKNVYSLGYNNQSLTQQVNQAIEVHFITDENSAKISIKKGKNANLSVTIDTNDLAGEIWSIDNPFSMYVPGLAGIPFEEEYKAFGAVRRSATRGDSNSIFRNIIYQLHEETDRWEMFLSTLRTVFPNIDILISCDLQNTAVIDATVSFNSATSYLPIDSMGTGILQTIQICAYIYLFQPRILLLDEPDSHLHPNNQIALANVLIELTQNMPTRIILATHSRTLIGALKTSAKFFRVNQGTITEDFDEYSCLLELGALDDIDRLKCGQYKWIILTEDTKTQSQKALKLILEANGLIQNEYKLYPYAGTGNVNAAKLTAEFIAHLHPSIKVLIHMDRDGRSDTDVQEDIKRYSNSNGKIQAFITECNDIESYFCRANHVQTILDNLRISCSSEDVVCIIDNATDQLKDCSLERMITHRSKGSHNDQGKIAVTATKEYAISPNVYVYGKALRGSIARHLQEKFGKNINLFSVSQYLTDDSLQSILCDSQS